MDIAAILAAADDEVAYEQDTFESVPPLDDTLQSNGSYQHSSRSPRGGEDTKNLTASDILKSAAQAVAKEEAREATAAFTSAASEVQHELQHGQQEREREETRANVRFHDRDAVRAENEDAMNLLLQAADDVAELHKLPDNFADEVKQSHEGKDEDLEEDDYAAIDTDHEDEWDDEEEEADDDTNDVDGNRSRKQSAVQDLLFAIYHGQTGRVETLLRQSGDAKTYLQVDRHGWCSVHWAAARGNTDIMEVLLDHHKARGKSICKLLHRRDGSRLAGWMPLHIAAVCGQLHMAELLVERGASLRKKDHMGEFPFEVIGKHRSAKQLLRLLHPKPPKELFADSASGRQRDRYADNHH